MQHFVFLLTNCSSILEWFINLKFSNYFVLFIVGPNSHILYTDTIELRLINKSFILFVSDLSFSTCFKLFPGLLFNHSSVSIHVLSVESDLLQFLGESFILSFLVKFLFIYLLISFNQSLFSHFFFHLFQVLLLLQFNFTSVIVFLFSLISCLLNFWSCMNQFICLLILFSEIILSLIFNILFDLSLLMFDSFSKLGNRHLFKKTVTTSFSWIKTFSSYDRNLFKLSDLSN